MKKIISFVGAAAGAVSVVFSFVILGFDTGSFENNVSYGGDAYTGIQNASAQAANNVQYLAEIVKFGFFAVLFVAGVMLLCHYVPVIIESGAIKTGKAEVKVAAENGPERVAAESDELKKYKDLLDNGVISAEEYGEKAREILGLAADNEITTAGE